MNLNFNGNKIDADRQQILSHHDVVYNFPVCDPMYGIPIGNGDMGALLWLDNDKFIINLNKTDLWDECDQKGGVVIPEGEENMTTCRNGVKISLDFGCPVFDGIYTDDYKGRISLYDATASVKTQTRFCNLDLMAFASDKYDVVAVKTNVKHTDSVPFEIAMERWGSRTLAYWYFKFEPNKTGRGLGGTNAYEKDGAMLITQKLNGTVFTAGIMMVCDNKKTVKPCGNHKIKTVYENGEAVDCTAYMTIGVSDNAQDAEKIALNNLKNAVHDGYETIYDIHKQQWADFWKKSFVSLSDDLDYIENLWYLNFYYGNSCMRGKYPMHMSDVLWGHYHDFKPWNHYFHYNLQHQIHPLGAANHLELGETYLNFRATQLSIAKEFAEKYKHAKGAFYTDVCDKFGRMEARTGENCTVGSQLAMMMYNHYLYSGDGEFLKEKALPLMTETANYYLDVLKKNEDGKYHIYGTQGYEGSPLFTDSITDHCMIRSLFEALKNVLNETEYAPYKEVLENLAPFMTTDIYEDELDGDVFRYGVGKGKKPAGSKVLSVGINEDGEYMRRTFGDPENDWYGFPDTEMAPVFPACILGIKDKGSELYNLVYNSICLHHPFVPFWNHKDDWYAGMCMGWCMMPIYLSRMGLNDMLEKVMLDMASVWITYPNGMGIIGGYNRAENGIKQNDRFAKNTVRNLETDVQSPAMQWNFRHFDYETVPIITSGINEMLIQSYDGVVRLFGAVNEEKSYAFSLMATGGFAVDAKYSGGNCEVCIISQRGGMLTLSIDNISATPGFYKNEEKFVAEFDGKVYKIKTNAGDVIKIVSDDDFEIVRDYSKNNDAKFCGQSQLGCVKQYA